MQVYIDIYIDIYMNNSAKKKKKIFCMHRMCK